MAGRNRGRGQTRGVRGSPSKRGQGNVLDEERMDSVHPLPSDYQQIYMQLYESKRFNVKDLASLEISQFLETQLWPTFHPRSTEKSHIMLIIMMVNEKFREKVAAWECFKSRPNDFKRFFSQVLDLILSSEVSMEEKTHILVFLIHCFNSLEVKLVRDELGDLISIRIWSHLSHHRLNKEFKRYPKFEKLYKKSMASIQKLDQSGQMEVQKLASFIPKMLDQFKSILLSQTNTAHMIYVERFLELLTDIESSLVTRRFVDTLLDDKFFPIYLLTSNLYKSKSKETSLYHHLVDNFCFYHKFQVDIVSGSDYSELESLQMHYESFEALQRTTFALFPNILSDFYLSSVANVDSKEDLIKHFSVLTDEQLLTLMKEVGLIYHHEDCSEAESFSREFLMTLLAWNYQKIESQLSQINRTPLYPTESMIWDENLIPSESYNGENCLSLPKLNLQFLTLHDYLLRNFHLFRYESTYEIKSNLEDSISRMNPIQSDEGVTVFTGWARMALPINQFVISHIGRNNLGQSYPSRVMADVTIDIKMRQDFAFEWQTLRRGDPCFLVAISCAEFGENKQKNHTLNFAERFGVRHVRGCEIYGMLDEDGQVIDESVGAPSLYKFTSSKRVYRVFLDCSQYQLDTDFFANGGSDVYSSLNLIMRRKQKENNFKAVLETIRSLMNTECVVPDWLLSTFLGYESLSSEDITSEGESKTINFCDTFLDVNHVYRSFSDCNIENTLIETADACVLDAVLTFSGLNDKNIKLVSKASVDGDDLFSSYSMRLRRNTIPFTCSQVKAIKSAMQQGLTLIVGPPGTGKTDVAVQIISNLYHSFPNQRTLIVAHSNQALNQIFQKIIALNVDEKHCLRLGHGEEMLETEKDFSRTGRVNYVLTRRLQLLREVERLQHSLQIPGDMSFTCETAVQFFSNQILPRWNKFLKICTSYHSGCSSTNDENELELNQLDVQQQFPFFKFVYEWYSVNSDNFNVSLFDNLSSAECLSKAKHYFKQIKSIFDELDEFRPFELLRNSAERSKYLLLKTAKIIAMTCTHASLKRSDLVELCFKYDNVLMEEAGQILEIETFIPLLLQNPESNKSRLKRVTLIGDHHQLPPVVKNMGFKRFSNLEQSLFARMIRVGVPFIELDAQGRSRESICKLFSWRYANLSSLEHVLSKPEYMTANAGFMFTYQLINVDDLNGVGESEPTQFFYQNLAEAEYAVNLFIYMRVLGYPATSISIITTYNGQKHLIRDVLKQKTASNPLLGVPHKVTTVDRYQGQQNDYVIVSLVRTKNVGHIRDVRRLVVALSRARLGLYILGRVSLFSTCFELSHAISLLSQHPSDLVLIPNERFPSLRQASDDESSIPSNDKLVISTIHQLAELTKELYMTHLHYLEEQYQLMQDNLKSLQKDLNDNENVDKEQSEMNGDMNLEEYGQNIQNEISEE